MDLIQYNEKYYVTKFFFPKDKFILLVNNGSLYIKEPTDKFKISFSMYIPISAKKMLIENFKDINFIENDILKCFYQGKKSEVNIKKSFYAYEDISGLYLYVSFDELLDCQNLLHSNFSIASRTSVVQLKLKEKKKLFLEDYLFNTNLTEFVLPNEDVKDLLYSNNNNLSIMIILNRFFLFRTTQ